MSDIWRETDRSLQARHVPIAVMMEVTRRCNLSCIHCYSVRDERELSLVQIEDIANQLREAGTLFLTLTGGEPLVREDFLDIVGIARGIGFDVKLITNGTLVTGEIADGLARLAVSEAGVSVLGATAETHDGLTRVPGSWEKSVAAVRMLKERGVPVHMKSTLMRENFPERAGIARLAEELGVTCLMDPVVSPRNDGSTDVLAHRLSEEQMEGVYRDHFDQREEDDGTYRPLFCEAGSTFAAVSAAGELYPCIQLPAAAGNILEDGFARVWEESALLEKMRTATKADLKGCAECRFASGCYRCPGLAYLEEGDAFGPSPTACFVAGCYERYQIE